MTGGRLLETVRQRRWCYETTTHQSFDLGGNCTGNRCDGNVRGINSSEAGTGCAVAERRLTEVVRSCDASGGGEGVVLSTFGEPGTDEGIIDGESFRWITSQVESGISNRLTRSVVTCE